MKYKDLINITIANLNSYQEGDLIALTEAIDNLKDLSKLFIQIDQNSIIVNIINDIINGYELLHNHDDLNKNLKASLKSIHNLNPEEHIVDIESKFKEIQKYINETTKANKKEETIEDKSKKENLYEDNYFSEIAEDKDILMQFCDESKEHLDNSQFSLIDLEYDTSNQELINLVFRAFHTIKGSSAFLGLKIIEELAHEMENLLVEIRDKKLHISDKLIDVIFFGIGILRDLIQVIELSNYDKNEMIEGFRQINIFKYILVIHKILDEYKVKKIGDILVDDGKIDKALINQILKKQKETDKKFGEIAIEENLIKQEDIQDALSRQKTMKKKINYVKVSNDRLNALVDIVGELVVNQSMIKDILTNKNKSESNLDETLTQLEAITTNIKNLVLSMGMVPISDIFNKLRVVIRNLSKEENKLVIVKIDGETTELDRNIIEAIYDPLVHIVRNAVDHGIEDTNKRKELGKKTTGTINISAEHKGNGIDIIVQDDGGGINKDSILAKALEKDLISEDQSHHLTDNEIYNLMFEPGFSTAEKVTEVSGRGVGLDVVKKNIEEIKGRIEISSELGKGSSFIIKLPLTLAIIDGFVTVVSGTKYIFPFNLINEIIVPDKNNLSVMDNGQVMLFNREKYIPVLKANEIFDLVIEEKDINQHLIIVIQYENKKYGIAVDNIIGKQEIVIKNLGNALKNLAYFSGGTIFGDGSIGFVIDVEEFIKEAKENIDRRETHENMYSR